MSALTQMRPSFIAVCGLMIAGTVIAASDASKSAIRCDYSVVEFRRYVIKDGERAHFAARFESFFPEAIQQTGAIVAGEFMERANPSTFTWIRCFHDMDDRARLNGELYYGPVWKEHRTQMNDLLADSDNVLLLRPLDPQHGVTVLPAVDPLTEPRGAQGIVVAQLFTLKADALNAFPGQAEASFASYRDAGAREAGILVTLDAKNNFPQLPIRTDGPYLLWLGILPDNDTLEHRFTPLAERAAQSLSAAGLLRRDPELIILDPAPRSRMRWRAGW